MPLSNREKRERLHGEKKKDEEKRETRLRFKIVTATGGGAEIVQNNDRGSKGDPDKNKCGKRGIYKWTKRLTVETSSAAMT